jgi:chromosome segregation ATPase
MNFPEYAQLEEDFENLQVQYRDLETELNEAKAEINELKAQLNAKEGFATTHRESVTFNGTFWERDVTIIAPEFHEVGA